MGQVITPIREAVTTLLDQLEGIEPIKDEEALLRVVENKLSSLASIEEVNKNFLEKCFVPPGPKTETFTRQIGRESITTTTVSGDQLRNAFGQLNKNPFAETRETYGDTAADFLHELTIVLRIISDYDASSTHKSDAFSTAFNELNTALRDCTMGDVPRHLEKFVRTLKEKAAGNVVRLHP
ncbi:hypothetical protein IPG41_03035 [Candidatus Peregrinibacteria bacterium]|nr:MAG: hypothetical protein IPG41_03035 [Candidatus Peregrinibacteria bacterium]